MALEPVLLSSRPLTLAALALALLIGGCDRESDKAAQPQPSASAVPKGAIDRSHKGAAMPEFMLSDPAGKELRLSSLRGKPLLINLWATWCAPCIAELPQLATIAGEGKLRVLTVSQDMGEPAKVAAFLKERGLAALEPWLDPKNDLSFHYGTGTLPTSVLYDAQGREVWRYVGERTWTDAESRALLAEAR